MLVAELGAAPFFEETVALMKEARGEGRKGEKDEAALAANWIVNEVFARLNAQGATVRTVAPWREQRNAESESGKGSGRDGLFLSPRALAALLSLVASEEVSGKAAKEVLDAMIEDREAAAKGPGAGSALRSPEEIVDELGLGQISDPVVLERLCRAAIGLRGEEEGEAKGGGEGEEEEEQEEDEDEAEETREMLEAYRGGNKRVFGQFVARVLAASGNRANPKLAAAMLRDLLNKV